MIQPVDLKTELKRSTIDKFKDGFLKDYFFEDNFQDIFLKSNLNPFFIKFIFQFKTVNLSFKTFLKPSFQIYLNLFNFYCPNVKFQILF